MSTAGMDYNANITEFLFEDAPQQECIQINILNDEKMEQRESFLVLLNTTLTSQTVSLNPQYAFVTIIDDDSKLSFYVHVPDLSEYPVSSELCTVVLQKSTHGQSTLLCQREGVDALSSVSALAMKASCNF